MRLSTKQCIIRDWRRSDEASLLREANNHAVWRNVKDVFPHPYTAEDADRWFTLLENMDEATHWAIEIDGEAVGGIGVTLRQDVYAHSAEIGYWLGETYWGRGIATEAMRAVVPYAMKRYDLLRLEAPVFAWNPASARVLEKCGFAREGVLRSGARKEDELVDIWLYAFVNTAGEHAV